MKYKLPVFIFLIALVTAILEVQIEGYYGWAQKLPTWRTDNQVYSTLMNGKPLTGYHIAINLLLLLFFHYPFVINAIKPTLSNELLVLSDFFIFVIFWDFLWFVVNPWYGIQNFNIGSIAWDKKWIWIFPVEYYSGAATSVILFSLSKIRTASLNKIPKLFMTEWLPKFLVFITLTLAVIISTEIGLVLPKIRA